jgi:hypothetical protein
VIEQERTLWQSQRFVGQEQDRVLAELLSWLHEYEDAIVEFQTLHAREPEGAHVYVVCYRARRLEFHPHLA